MYFQLNCAIVDAEEANRQEMSAFLAQFGVHLVAQFHTPEQLGAVLGRNDPPQLVIINLDPAAHETLRKVAHLPRQYPHVNFFVMSQVLDPNLLMDAMHHGVREFIPLPISEEKFAAAVERVAQLHGMGKRAKVFLPKARDWMSTNSWIVNEIVLFLFIGIVISSIVGD